MSERPSYHCEYHNIVRCMNCFLRMVVFFRSEEKQPWGRCWEVKTKGGKRVLQTKWGGGVISCY